jgi:hypothetical protein
MGLPAKKRGSWKVELQGVARRHGNVLKAEDVVDFARDPRTALHSRFTWDDTLAAHQYRLEQARALIRIVVTVIPGHNREFRVFASMQADRVEQGGGYRYMVSILGNKAKRQRFLAEALAEFDRWKEKYEALEELAEVFSARKKIS